MPNEKSSFLKRTLSKEDVIIQFFRPRLAGRVNTALDAFERMVNEAETLTKLGIMIQPGGEKFHITPADLRANLDEFSELESLATKGRALLKELGYETQRKQTPPVGAAPVGKTVNVMPITTQLPGEEPLQGVRIMPVDKPEETSE